MYIKSIYCFNDRDVFIFEEKGSFSFKMSFLLWEVENYDIKAKSYGEFNAQAIIDTGAYVWPIMYFKNIP